MNSKTAATPNIGEGGGQSVLQTCPEIKSFKKKREISPSPFPSPLAECLLTNLLSHRVTEWTHILNTGTTGTRTHSEKAVIPKKSVQLLTQ